MYTYILVCIHTYSYAYTGWIENSGARFRRSDNYGTEKAGHPGIVVLSGVCTYAYVCIYVCVYMCMHICIFCQLPICFWVPADTYPCLCSTYHVNLVKIHLHTYMHTYPRITQSLFEFLPTHIKCMCSTHRVSLVKLPLHTYIHTCTHTYIHTCVLRQSSQNSFTCTHTCTHTYIRTCVLRQSSQNFVGWFIYFYMYICTHTYIHTYRSLLSSCKTLSWPPEVIYIYICTHTYIHRWVIHILIHIHIDTYVHTYIRTYIHTYRSLLSSCKTLSWPLEVKHMKEVR